MVCIQIYLEFPKIRVWITSLLKEVKMSILGKPLCIYIYILLIGIFHIKRISSFDKICL